MDSSKILDVAILVLQSKELMALIIGGLTTFLVRNKLISDSQYKKVVELKEVGATVTEITDKVLLVKPQVEAIIKEVNANAAIVDTPQDTNKKKISRGLRKLAQGWLQIGR